MSCLSTKHYDDCATGVPWSANMLKATELHAVTGMNYMGCELYLWEAVIVRAVKGSEQIIMEQGDTLASGYRGC